MILSFHAVLMGHTSDEAVIEKIAGRIAKNYVS
jgi:hypothetical protein